MLKVKVLNDRDNQVIIIPNEMHISEKELYIAQVGKGFCLLPQEDPWFLLRNSLGVAGVEPFERNQPQISDELKQSKKERTATSHE